MFGMKPEQFQRYAQNVLNRFFQATSDPDKVYAFQNFGSGDMLITGCLLYTLLPKFKKKSAVLITQERYKAFDVQFDGVSEIMYFNHIDMWIIAELFFHRTKHYGDHQRFLAHWRRDENGNTIRDARLSMTDGYRLEVFDIPLNTPLHAPAIGQISDEAKQKLHRDYTVDKERTVIIAPWSGAGLNVNPSFWYKLIDQLKAKKYIVYNNVGKTPANTFDQPFPNAMPLNVSHNELIYLAKNVRCIVGMRSGLMDILSFSHGDLICLMHPKWYDADLKLNYPQAPARINSIYYNFDLMPKLKALMEEFDVAAMSVGNMKHKKFDTLYWTEDSYRDAILNAVDDIKI